MTYLLQLTGMETMKPDSDLNEMPRISDKDMAILIVIVLVGAGLLFVAVKALFKTSVSSPVEVIKESALSAADIATMLNV